MSVPARRAFKLLVCDLDNTLFDWVRYFVPAFYSMIDVTASILKCDIEVLLDEMREVHRVHHDSEHPFALLETKTVRNAFPNKPHGAVAKELDEAFHAFNASRKHNLRLYSGVLEGLELLAGDGIKLVAHTESKLYGALDRLDRLGLSEYFSKIYCRERPNSVHPDPNVARRWLQRFPMQKVVELSHHQRKPSRDVLLEICDKQDVAPGDAAYVGDSISRDVMMAKDAGVFAIWAKYGAEVSREEYQKLVRISHWTPEDVAREIELKRRAESVMPNYVASSFSEVVTCVRGASNLAS